MTSKATPSSQPPEKGRKRLLAGARPPAALLKPVEDWGEEEERLFEAWTEVLYERMKKGATREGAI